MKISVTVPGSVPVNRSGPHADDLNDVVVYPERASDHFRVLTEPARPIVVESTA